MYIDRFDHFGIQHLMQVDEHYWVRFSIAASP